MILFLWFSNTVGHVCILDIWFHSMSWISDAAWTNSTRKETVFKITWQWSNLIKFFLLLLVRKFWNIWNRRIQVPRQYPDYWKTCQRLQEWIPGYWFPWSLWSFASYSFRWSDLEDQVLLTFDLTKFVVET